MLDELEKSAQTNETDVVETKVEEVVENNADNDNDTDFSEEEGGKGEENASLESETDKPWKNEQNAKQARLRREAERKAELKKAKHDAIIETLNGLNPYTNEKIEDAADIEEYLTMKEIEKSGKDPVLDYARFLKNKAKEQEKATQATTSQEEWFSKDRAEFTSKHPDVNLGELVGDEMFRTFAIGKIGKIPMTKIYNDYQVLTKLSDERAKTKAAQILANNASNPGKLSNQSPAPEKSVKDMSKADFEAMVERVKRGEQK